MTLDLETEMAPPATRVLTAHQKNGQQHGVEQVAQRHGDSLIVSFHTARPYTFSCMTRPMDAGGLYQQHENQNGKTPPRPSTPKAPTAETSGSASPMPNPPIMAPGMEPTPPSTAATIAQSPSMAPMVGLACG